MKLRSHQKSLARLAARRKNFPAGAGFKTPGSMNPHKGTFERRKHGRSR